MAEVLVRDNRGALFVATFDGAGNLVGRSAVTNEAGAIRHLGEPITNVRDLPGAHQANQRNLENQLGANLGGAISLDVRLGGTQGPMRDFHPTGVPPTPFPEVEEVINPETGVIEQHQIATAVGTVDPDFLEEKQKREQERANFFAQAKLLYPNLPDSLLRVYVDAWVEFGSQQLALAAMRQSPEYDTVFAGNRRPDGTIRMAEHDYLSTVEGYRQRLSNFGVPAGTILNPDKIVSLIEGDVSVQEFEQRLNTAYTGLIQNINEVREFYAANFGAGNLSDSAIFASAIDPSQSPLVFQREIEQAQIGGEARLRGFSIDLDEAERLESFGLDQRAARDLFGQAQRQLPRLNDLIERFNDPDDEVTLEEFSDAVVLTDPDQLRQFNRLFRRQSSSFSRTGGIREDATQALIGLRER